MMEMNNEFVVLNKELLYDLEKFKCESVDCIKEL